MSTEANSIDEKIAQSDPLPITDLKGKSGKEPASSPPPPEKPTGITEADIMPGGRKEKAITIDTESRTELANRFTAFQNTLREMQSKGIVLTPQQRLYTDSDVLTQLEQGNISKDGLGLMLSAIHDEQLQKSRYLGVRAKNSPMRTEIKRSLRRRKGPHEIVTEIPPTTGLVDTETADRVTSPYIEHSGFTSFDRGRQEDDFTSLNELRLHIEQSLVEGGFKNPLFESDDATGFPVTGEHANGSLLQIKQYEKRAEILKERGLEGRSMDELFAENPTQAYEIAEEAINRALLEVARDEGKRLLSESPRISGTSLEKHAMKLEKKPEPEDHAKAILELEQQHQAAEKTLIETQQAAEAKLTETQQAAEAKLTETQQTAESMFSNAQQVEGNLRTQRDEAQNDYDKAKQDYETAKAQYTKGLTLLNENIDGFSDQIGNLQDELAALPAVTKDNEKTIGVSRQKLMSEIAGLETKIGMTREAVLQRLDSQEAAEQKMVTAKERLDRTYDDWETARDTLEDAHKELQVRKTAFSTAQEANQTALKTLQESNRTKLKRLQDKHSTDLKTLQEEQAATLKAKRDAADVVKDAPPEKKEQAAAIRTWGKLMDGENFRNIIDARFTQKPEGPYTKKKLGDTTEVNGHVEGAEAIRAHLFKLIDPVNYNPEQARKMISDETIARALIYQLRIDPETISSLPDPNFVGPMAPNESYGHLLGVIHAERDALSKLNPKNTRHASEIQIRQEKIRTIENGLLKDLLPTLEKRSEFEVGSVIRFLAHEGLRAAEQDGNPYLDLSDEKKYTISDFQKPELSQTAESIVREDLGTATLTKETATWVGNTRPEWAESREFGTQLDITTRITQRFSGDGITRGRIGYDIAVQLNQRLLESLTETVDPLAPHLPENLHNYFYDARGNFRQELGPMERFIQRFNPGVDNRELRNGKPEWITIQTGVIEDNPLNSLSTGADRAESIFLERLPALINPVPGEEDIAARNNMETAFGMKIIEMNDQERRDAVSGISARIPLTVPVAGTGSTKDYEVDIDNNGNILIGEPGATPRKQLRQHLKDRMLELQTLRGTTTLDQADRDAFWFEETQILQLVGREVLVGQQRKQ